MEYQCSLCGKTWELKTSANRCCGHAIEVKKFKIPGTEAVFYVSSNIDAQAKEDAYEKTGPHNMLRNKHEMKPYLIMYGYYLHEYLQGKGHE